MIKKTALSLLVIAGSGGYVWTETGGNTVDKSMTSAASLSSVQPQNIPAAVMGDAAPRNAAVTSSASLNVTDGALPPRVDQLPSLPVPPASDALAPTVMQSLKSDTTISASADQPIADVPMPRFRPQYHPPLPMITRAAMRLAGGGAFTDGAYTGPPIDAYYGLVQVQAIIQGGRLVGIKVLQYPSHRQTSVAINRQALPMLRDEVVAAQSANVDIISGATLTSEAFIRSLGSALKQGAA